MGRIAALGAFLLLAGLAQAASTPVKLSGFEVNDTAATTARDSLEFAETWNGGAETDIRVVTKASTDYVHDANNGGDASSRWALRVGVTGTNRAYYTLPLDLALSTISLGFNLHADTVPAAGKARTLAMFTAADNGAACAIRLNSDRKLELLLNGVAAPAGPSTETLPVGNVCTNYPTTACTTGADCPDGACSASCASTAATTQAGCYWAGIELVELNANPYVTCELWINGNKSIVAGPSIVAGLDPVLNVRIGAACGAAATCTNSAGVGMPAEDGTATVFFDDVVVANGDRAGLGWVATATPAADFQKGWTASSGSTHYTLVNQYAVSPYTYKSTDRVSHPNIGAKVRTEAFSAITPIPTIPTGGAVTAVSLLAAGETNNTTDFRSVQLGLLDCDSLTSCPTTAVKSCAVNADCDAPSATCDATTKACKFPKTSSTAILMDSWTRTASARIGDASLSTANLTRMGLLVRSTPANANQMYLADMVLYLRVQRPDAPLPVRLRDHNVGADDGVVTVYTYGDSTNGGVHSAACSADPTTLCGVDFACSWAPYKATPSGGCTTAAQCQTCAQRRLADLNGGAGYPCGPNNGGQSCDICGADDGAITGGCCAGGFCDGDTSVSCVVDADCYMGNCDTSSNRDASSGYTTPSTCDDACPGAGNFCPNARTSWGDALAISIGADVIVRCSTDGETSGAAATVLTGASGLLATGANSNCIALRGTGTCTCTTNAQCGSGGTCSGGVCTAGAGATCTSDSACNACGTGTDCSSGTCTAGACSSTNTLSTCKFKPPDYLLWLEHYNDVASYSDARQCTGPLSAGLHTPGHACQPASITRCTSATDCAAVDAASECYGFTGFGGLTDSMCTSGNFCTTFAPTCDTDATCAFFHSGLTCKVGPGGAAYSDIVTGLRAGVCQCSANGDCPTGYKCKGDLCRKSCAADADCGGLASSCTNVGGDLICKGSCTAPSHSRTCTTDADCASTERWTSSSPQLAWNGTCTDGHCTCTGPAVCMPKCVGETTPTNCGDTADGKCAGVNVACSCDTDCQSAALCTPQWIQANGPFYEWGLANEATVAAYLAGLGEATPPVLLPMTIPPLAIPEECGPPLLPGGGGRQRSEILARISDRLVSTYSPRVIDARLGMAKLDGRTWHSDDTHFNAVGGAAIGGIAATYLSALNSCARGQCVAPGLSEGAPCTTTGDCTGAEVCTFGPRATPQRYCQAKDGSWTSTTCTTSCADPTQRCQLRPCACGCSTSGECASRFGAAYSCSAGACVKTSDSSTACKTLDAAMTACTAGVCTGADPCPAAGDICNLE